MFTGMFVGVGIVLAAVLIIHRTAVVGWVYTQWGKVLDIARRNGWGD
jgi:hypothetical protein